MKHILLIIFIIIVCCIVIAAGNCKQSTIITSLIAGSIINSKITGGSLTDSSLQSKHALIDSNSTIVFDCHNMIHNLQNTDTFSNNLRYLSQIISNALSSYDLHFVIKNPNDIILDHVTDKLDNPKPKKSQMLLAYFNQLVTLGKSFPMITYHLAQGNEPKTNRNHYLKGRDDFLSIYLAKDQYVVSQDRYKDFSSFDNIKPFYHLSTKAGTIFKKTKIDPKAYFSRINKPTTGSHLTYQFVTNNEANELGVKSGDIIVEKTGSLTKLYLVKS